VGGVVTGSHCLPGCASDKSGAFPLPEFAGTFSVPVTFGEEKLDEAKCDAWDMNPSNHAGSSSRKAIWARDKHSGAKRSHRSARHGIDARGVSLDWRKAEEKKLFSRELKNLGEAQFCPVSVE
jgi:hypothetical protein